MSFIEPNTFFECIFDPCFLISVVVPTEAQRQDSPPAQAAASALPHLGYLLLGVGDMITVLLDLELSVLARCLTMLLKKIKSLLLNVSRLLIIPHT